MTAGEAEASATEYMLGLETMLGGAVGRKARQIHGRAGVRDIRPLLLRQRSILARMDKLTDAGADPSGPEFLAADERALAIDGEIARAWTRCLEQLQALWLTDGRVATEDGP